MALPETKTSWFSRLREGLSKTSSSLSEGITGIFTKRPLDQAALDALEEALLSADVGPKVATRLVETFGRGRFGKEISDAEVKQALAEQIAEMLAPVAHPLLPDPEQRPCVVLVVGVNGNGKTTTIGKLASRFAQSGLKIMLAAADTFRAAAVEQLKVWSVRSGVPIITGPEGSDPASVAYQAFEQAKAAGIDLLFIDTAGRLHNKNNLMQELQKLVRVLKKIDPAAPHIVLQVLDGTTGQNALAQVQAFQELIGVTGLIVTKLDGTAKGGVVLSLAERFKLPIHAIGVGETIEDLQPFEAMDFARSLVGIDGRNI